MKKTAAILLPFIVLSSYLLSSCGETKTILTFGDMNISSENLYNQNNGYSHDISYGDLEDKIVNKKENFLLAVANFGCECWSNFSSVLKSYNNSTNTFAYRISYSCLTENNQNTFGIKVARGHSSFAIIKDGRVEKTLCTSINKKEMYSLDKFTNYMNKAITLPKMYFINDETFSSYIANENKTSTIYFGRSGCGDCQSVEPTILKPYFETHKDSRNLYVLDCQKHYPSSTASEEEKNNYQTFKDNIYLSNKNNQFGYGDGVFPSFMLFENGNNITSGAVAYNDKIENKIITDSYYTSERATALTYLNNFEGTKVLKGLEIPDNELDNNERWKHECANKYYAPLINAFLNYALPKTK